MVRLAYSAQVVGVPSVPVVVDVVAFLSPKKSKVDIVQAAGRAIRKAPNKTVRLHSKLGNLPPNAFEHQSAIKQPIGVCEIT